MRDESILQDIGSLIRYDRKIKATLRHILFLRVFWKFLFMFSLIFFIIFVLSIYFLKTASIENFIIKASLGLLFSLSIGLSFIFLFLDTFYSPNLSKNINKIIHKKEKIELIYSKFLNSRTDLQDITDFKLSIVNFKSEPKRKRKSYANYMSTLLNRETPIKKNNENSLDFKFKNYQASFVIEHPLEFTRWTLKYSWKESRSTIGSKKLSMSVLYIENKEFRKMYYNLKIKKSGELSGDYRTESIAFNNKYSTNLESNDLEGAKFLNPTVVNNLVNFNDINFFALGVYKQLYVERYETKRENCQIGIFNFLLLKNRNKVIEYIYDKIVKDIDFLKKSYDYINFIL
ncbi:hypothetical protein [Spiroplasma floricola]|uniref:DUF3137 domain-containing protein n=1 Tax=Spiroplasma floricola 23-6 TaxID=1336749 RepID=A0A2K8SCU6_9MOLU|nr:hypothetical protein [Spiroplasma floricola]AUB31135.1 hypothetical protein SFLOR_v1c00740 [Spiroplasma floricola 23-6]